MKVQCPNCQTFLKVPERYIGKRAKCLKCNHSFVIDLPPTPAMSQKAPLPKSKDNIFIKLWSGSPVYFRNSFLATLGIISALVFAYYMMTILKTVSKESVQEAKSSIDKAFDEYVASQYDIEKFLPNKCTVLYYNNNVFCPYFRIHTNPMTLTELEAFGDRLRKKYPQSNVLKIQVYWNLNVAQFCIGQEYNGDSQCYISALEKGRRAQYSVRLGEPTSLNDDDLYQFFCKNNHFWHAWEPVGFDSQKQIVYLKTTVDDMAYLAWHTFRLLGNSARGCLFDRLPNLKFVKIDYFDSENKKIGEGYFDFNYWVKMISVNNYYSKMTELKGPDAIYGNPDEVNIAMWEELAPLIKDFYLIKQLPKIKRNPG